MEQKNQFLSRANNISLILEEAEIYEEEEEKNCLEKLSEVEILQKKVLANSVFKSDTTFQIEEQNENQQQKSKKIRFWSTFDQGNLKSVKQINNNTYQLQFPKDSNRPANKGTSCWFYFRVLSQAQMETTFILTGFNFPIFFTQFKEGKEILIKQKGKKQWEHIQTNCVKVQKQTKSFDVEFSANLEANTEYSIAFTYPWSYQHNQKWQRNIEYEFKKKSKSIYFHKELLTYSVLQNKIELFTISSMKGIDLDEKENVFNWPNLFPRHCSSSEMSNSNASNRSKRSNQSQQEGNKEYERPFKFKNKKYILIGCRIHAGETPANYMLRGITNFLMKDTSDSKQFLDEFVLVFIPILNPDGVIQGHYRLDHHGNDLNRCYNLCQDMPSLFPGNNALLKVAKDLDSQNKLFAFFDLHAHVNHEGGFMYGNTHKSKKDIAEMKLVPKIMSYYVKCFKYKKCGFNIKEPSEVQNQTQLIHQQKQDIPYSQQKPDIVIQVQNYNENGEINLEQQKNEKKQQKIIQCLQGVGKTDIFLSTQINLSYTVECNYTFYTKMEQPQTLAFCQLKPKVKRYKMRISDFEQMGEGLCISMLEYVGKKQDSIFNKENIEYSSLEELRQSLINNQ